MNTSLKEEYSQLVKDIGKGGEWTPERIDIYQRAMAYKASQEALRHEFVNGILPSVRDDFRNQVLERHNQLRNLHSNTNGVTLNVQLQEEAQAWANKLAADNSGLLHDDNRNGAGENLYFMNNSLMFSPTGAETTDVWYKEYKNYNFITGQSTNGQPIGHFTQVVWKATTEIGAGIASDSHGKYYVCVRYRTAGNTQGQYVDNVMTTKPGAQLPA
uniref:Golgi-associated plant pathogenesis-related protein 1-like n=1 Tax=Ciona intestinalis TaxID=7719 RepID=UPI0000521AE6|nr:Golgi-associated plant pathogenesis-related protein 1-like [Ciona intestinalis]|eukprot:XP_002125560.1 Golgi-associated plant pathogenesis-related protein 1-like [Ciona intestinalis]